MRRTTIRTLLLVGILFVCTIVLTACDRGNVSQMNSESTISSEPTISIEATTEPESHIHIFGEWETIQNPTCAATGEKVRVCSCGEKETESIAKLAHTEATRYAQSPTCTKTGLTEGKYCSVCNEELVAQDVVPKKSHAWKAASCTTPQTCSNCTATQGNALPHNISYTTSKCVDCGAFEYNVEYAVRGAVKATISWIGDAVDSFEIHNVYYVMDDKCYCQNCRAGDTLGEYYLTVIVFLSYTSNGIEDTYVDMWSVHKTHDPEADTHYLAGIYDQDKSWYFNGNKLVELYAADYSFYFNENDLIVVPKNIALG